MNALPKIEFLPADDPEQCLKSLREAVANQVSPFLKDKGLLVGAD